MHQGSKHLTKSEYSIIGPGFLGQYLYKNLPSCLYNRSNIDKLEYTDHNILIVTAPTGNRLLVGNSPANDMLDCIKLLDCISKTKYNYLIHISTVDTYQLLTSHAADPNPRAPHVPYGKNRWFLETQLQTLPRCLTIRLPSLIHPTIQKNILYDIKNQIWLEKINLHNTLQWYPLTQLTSDIEKLIKIEKRFENLVSEPITNQQIVEHYAPELLPQLKNNLIQNTLTYDVRSSNGKYLVHSDQIWQSFDKYFM
jgi:hypothetical protein